MKLIGGGSFFIGKKGVTNFANGGQLFLSFDSPPFMTRTDFCLLPPSPSQAARNKHRSPALCDELLAKIKAPA